MTSSAVPSVVLITGASRGIGRETARSFARRHFVVAINYLSHDAAAQETAQIVKSAGGEPFVVQGDIAKSGDVEKVVAAVQARFGRLDVLVNNAGTTRNRTLAKMSDAEWRDVMATNLDGVFYATRAAVKLMRAQGGGSIVNVTSYLANRAARGAANYTAAKAGVVALTKCTAVEEGANNIRANAVMPGFHATDMNRDVWARLEKEIRAQHLLPKLPDIGDAAEFIFTVSQLPTVTGQVFPFESRLV